MPRTIVYHPRTVNKKYAELYDKRQQDGNPVSRLPASSDAREIARDAVQKAAANPPAATNDETPSRDDLLTRIVKYVPAEMITVATLGFAAFPPDGNTIWVYLGIGAALNVIYLFGTALSAAKTPRPRGWFYLLSMGAFAGWAFATLDEVQKKAGISGGDATTKQGFILLVTAAFIPLLDVIFSRLSVTES